MLLELNSDVDVYNNLANSLTKRVQEAIKDKSIPLDDRWDLFSKSKFLPTRHFGDGFIGYVDTELTMYDDFYIDRGVTATYTEIYQHMQEMKKYDKNTLDIWREMVLGYGEYRFYHDW